MKMKATKDKAKYRFESDEAAWAAMHAMNAAGIHACSPQSLTIQVTICTWMEREKADEIAGSAPIEYSFGPTFSV